MKQLSAFFHSPLAGGILLGIAAIIALIMNNSALTGAYDAFINIPVAIKLGALHIDKPLLLWINDGLMAIFFLLVGLEIKREIVEGQLSSVSQISLPAIAAAGGVIAPALIYVGINWGSDDPTAMNGWAIPAATDIAFALGVLSLLGSRVPAELKVCLVAIAIIDDLVAIIIIALFYTANLALAPLGIAAGALVLLAILNARGVMSIGPYMLIGSVLWVCVLKSGVHATLAGVALAMFIPLRGENKHGKSPAKTLEHGLHMWVTIGILPLFAFANAGVSFEGLTLELLLQPVTLGIALGLFLGKQIGVLLFTWLGQTLRLCKLPETVSWRQYYGMALLTGIGFTMSLFIGGLAFEDDAHQRAVRLGVLLGSTVSGVAGYMLLATLSRKAQKAK